MHERGTQVWHVAVIAVFGTLLCLVVGLWGASLFVRAWAFRLDASVSRRRLRRLPKVMAGPRSRGQMWLGLLVGPLLTAGASVPLVLMAGSALGIGRGGVDRDVLVLSGATTLGVIALMALWVGWRFDPAKGRRRCPQCWYELEDLPLGVPCPECGHTATQEAQTLRMRRSKPVLIAGCVMMLAALGLVVAPMVGKANWTKLVPTQVLLWGWRWMPEGLVLTPIRGGATLTLEDRVGMPGFSSEPRAATLLASLDAEMSQPTDFAMLLRALQLRATMEGRAANWRIPTTRTAVPAGYEKAFAWIMALHADPKQWMTVDQLLPYFAMQREMDMGALMIAHQDAILARLAPPTGPADAWLGMIASHAPASDAYVRAIIALGLDNPPTTRTMWGTWEQTAASVLHQVIARAEPARRAQVMTRLLSATDERERRISARVSAMLGDVLGTTPSLDDSALAVLEGMARGDDDELAMLATMALYRSSIRFAPGTPPGRELLADALRRRKVLRDELVDVVIAWRGGQGPDVDVAAPLTALDITLARTAYGNPGWAVSKLWQDNGLLQDPCKEATLPWFRAALADSTLPAEHAAAIRATLADCLDKLEAAPPHP